MSLAARVRPIVLLLLLLGCDGGPSGPSTGNLTVTVLGLPASTSASVAVTGPDGFSQIATATQTFSALAPGTYTVAATTVTASGHDYTASPASQNVAVLAGGRTVNATVFYSTATGNLAVAINGLGTGGEAAVTVTGPGYSQSVPSSTTLFNLDPGTYTVEARDTVAVGGTPHTASPSSQTVNVAAHATANASVTYSPPPADGTVNLHVAGMYLTQSTQTYAGNVPLVRGRDGYLRVFVVANKSNTAIAAVKVRFFNGLLPVDSTTVSAGVSAPTAVDESSLSYSWNVLVPGSLIQPNLQIQAEVDPAGTVIETDETDNVYPAAAPLAMDVRTVPTLDVTFVPVIQLGMPSSRRLPGSVTSGNKDQFLASTQKMHPISTINSVLHSNYTTTTTDTLQAMNENGAWSTILEEIDLLRIAEASPRYYYGVVRVSYMSGVAGVAYVSTPSQGGRAALGWDKLPSASSVAAHELGHNWGRDHAPCGNPANVDVQYPQSDGSTGNYGLDVATATLEPPTLGDIMGYCDPKWIGGYTYRGVLNYLLAPSPPVLGVANQPVQSSLLVWGHIRNGVPVLEPAFLVNTRPALPNGGGPYTLTGQASDGTALFTFSFTPNRVADASEKRENFAFAVPLSSARADRLSSIRLSGRGREAVLSASTGGVVQPAAVEVRRAASGGVALRWDAAAHPMIMVRDPVTRQVLSFARGGNVELETARSQLELIMSNGVRSRVERMRVAP
ncbi:MAG TPA: zinc-dependent metalloprotease family protein [Gemmatimonadales bacterium]